MPSVSSPSHKMHALVQDGPPSPPCLLTTVAISCATAMRTAGRSLTAGPGVATAARPASKAATTVSADHAVVAGNPPNAPANTAYVADVQTNYGPRTPPMHPSARHPMLAQASPLLTAPLVAEGAAELDSWTRSAPSLRVQAARSASVTAALAPRWRARARAQPCAAVTSADGAVARVPDHRTRELRRRPPLAATAAATSVASGDVAVDASVSSRTAAAVAGVLASMARAWMPSTAATHSVALCRAMAARPWSTMGMREPSFAVGARAASSAGTTVVCTAAASIVASRPSSVAASVLLRSQVTRMSAFEHPQRARVTANGPDGGIHVGVGQGGEHVRRHQPSLWIVNRHRSAECTRHKNRARWGPADLVGW